MRTRALPALAAQATLFVIASVLAVRDAAGPFGGAGLVISIVPALAVLVAGAVRAARGIAGARPLLLAADLGLFAIAASTWTFSNPVLVDDPSWLYTATTVAAIVSFLATLALPAATSGTIERESWWWALPLAVAIVDVLAVGNYVRELSTSQVTDIAPVVATYALILAVSDGVSLVAWWWGSRWAPGIGSASSAGALAVAFAQNPESFATHRSDVAIAVVGIAIGLVAVAIGPTLRPSPVAPEPAPPLAADTGRRRWPLSRPAIVWSVVGSVLYLFLGLYGLYPVASDLCWSCIPAAPGQDVLIALTTISLVLAPISTLVLLLIARRPGGRWPAVVLIGTAVLGLADLLLAALGYGRFASLFVAAAPLALMGLGGLLTLWPRIGRRAGAIGALAAAGILVVWFSGPIGNTFSFDPGTALGSIPAGLLFPLALAWEGDRAVRFADPSRSVATPPDVSAPTMAGPGRNTIGPGHLDTPSGPA
jgi:hypothetical protein